MNVLWASLLWNCNTNTFSFMIFHMMNTPMGIQGQETDGSRMLEAYTTFQE